jgi:type II secretory pathway pseudopilin PulG
MIGIRRRHDDDSGITLIELIIYMVLAAVFLTIVSAIFINGWQSQTATADRDHSTGSANLVSASLQQSARNGVLLRTPDDHTLVATVATGAGTVQCRAWRLDGGALKYRTSTTAPLDLGGAWTTMADVAKTATFGPADPAVGTAPTKRVNYTITFQDSVTISGGLTAQAQVAGAGAGVTC